MTLAVDISNYTSSLTSAALDGLKSERVSQVRCMLRWPRSGGGTTPNGKQCLEG